MIPVIATSIAKNVTALIMRGNEPKSLFDITEMKSRRSEGIVASVSAVPANSGPSAATAADLSLLPDRGWDILGSDAPAVSAIGVDLGSSGVDTTAGWTGVCGIRAVGDREPCPFGDISGNALPTLFTIGATADDTAGSTGLVAFVRAGTALGIGTLTPSCNGFDPPIPVFTFAPTVFGVFWIDTDTGSLLVTLFNALVTGASGVFCSGNPNPTDGGESADADSTDTITDKRVAVRTLAKMLLNGTAMPPRFNQFGLFMACPRLCF